jgi:hypothetical protein
MIGLFTATPRVAATGAGGDDAAAAKGFGSALQEVLDGLVADTGQGEAGHPVPMLSEGAADADAEPEATSLVEDFQPAVTDGFAGVVVTVTPTGGAVDVELPVQAGFTVVDGEPQEGGQGADVDVMSSPMPAAARLKMGRASCVVNGTDAAGAAAASVAEAGASTVGATAGAVGVVAADWVGAAGPPEAAALGTELAGACAGC